MKRKLKVFIIAGEVSGDVLGAKIMREMLVAAKRGGYGKGVQFVGIGGENMKAVGLDSLFPISDLAVMGFAEVLANARTLTSRINETVAAIIREKPDIILTIDSPGFAKRVIKKVRNSTLHTPHSTLFYHIVAPQVWAWGEKRAKKYAEIFDKLYAFFDFEKPYFTKYGLKTIAVGHPIAEGLKAQGRNDAMTQEKVIALIPGSRMSEVKKLLPLMKAASSQLTLQNPEKNYKFFIPVVETTREYIEQETARWKTRPTLVASNKRYELFANTYIAIAASGTVSAELAIMHIPAVIVYKMNRISTMLARRVIKIKWVSLVNILLNKTVYPELLGSDATVQNVVAAVTKLSRENVRKKMIADLSSADKKWRRNDSAAALIAKDILK